MTIPPIAERGQAATSSLVVFLICFQIAESKLAKDLLPTSIGAVVGNMPILLFHNRAAAELLYAFFPLLYLFEENLGVARRIPVVADHIVQCSGIVEFSLENLDRIYKLDYGLQSLVTWTHSG